MARTLGHRSIASALIQRHDLTDRHITAGLTLSAAAGAGFAAALRGAAPAVGSLFGEPAVGPVLAALSLVLVIGGLDTVPEALWRRHLRFRALAGAEVLSQLLGYGARGNRDGGAGVRRLGPGLGHGRAPCRLRRGGHCGRATPPPARPRTARGGRAAPRRHRILVARALQPGGAPGQSPHRWALAGGGVARPFRAGDGAGLRGGLSRRDCGRGPVPRRGTTPEAHPPPRPRLSPRGSSCCPCWGCPWG